MKIDRLLSILIYMLNRDRVTARELAEHYEVSVRTIHRDMDALTYAGIPVVSMQGHQGGYGILNSYKLDRQLVDTEDLFFILTSLETIASTMKNRQLEGTLEKVKSLVREHQLHEFDRRRDVLHIDFSALQPSRDRELYYTLERAISERRLIRFQYTDSNHQVTQRETEPMTVVFQWYAWYLYGWCRLREDYRLFRLSRMEDIELLDGTFTRRKQPFIQYIEKMMARAAFIKPVKLRFNPVLRVHVEDYFRGSPIEIDEEGYAVVSIRFPENDWLYGLLLSYGEKVEVIDPPYIRQQLCKKCENIIKKYRCEK